MDIRSTGVTGKVADERCGAAGIVMNKNSIPYIGRFYCFHYKVLVYFFRQSFSLLKGNDLQSMGYRHGIF